ncbi:MAG: hypothetical protein ACRDCT_01320, partial [Shewanella sp.]
MKTVKVLISYLLGALGISLFSTSVWAELICEFSPGYNTLNFTMPLLKNSITVGRDLPLGSIIYRQTYQSVVNNVRCDDAGTIQLLRSYGRLPKPKTNWASQPWPNAIYETGVPGIGVVMWFSGRSYPNISNVANTPPENGAIIWSLINNLAFDVDFVKIGPISPGVIRAADLPSSKLDLADASKTLNIINVELSGDITIVSQTCQTPDVNVVLGTHSIEPLVAGSSSETPRKNFSVVMQNCPVFYGAGAWHEDKPIWHPIDGVR